MSEILVILSPAATAEQRKTIAQLAAPTQSASQRVFLAQGGPDAAARLRATPGIGQVLSGSEGATALPALDEAEALFAKAWLSTRGQKKQRVGDGLDWDTPPMKPPV